jgi:hypothetical protein
VTFLLFVVKNGLGFPFAPFADFAVNMLFIWGSGAFSFYHEGHEGRATRHRIINHEGHEAHLRPSERRD